MQVLVVVFPANIILSYFITIELHFDLRGKIKSGHVIYKVEIVINLFFNAILYIQLFI